MLKWFFVCELRFIPAFLFFKFVTVKASSLLIFYTTTVTTQTVNTISTCK